MTTVAMVVVSMMMQQRRSVLACSMVIHIHIPSGDDTELVLTN